MHPVELSYALRAGRGATARIRNELMDLLQAVQASGSISGAAAALGLSYRHAWGELRRWEGELGLALIVWERGQPARLTDFAGKLLWAERQVQARMAPQIEALHADLERAFAIAFDDQAQVLTLFASHGDALVALREHAAAQARLHLDVRFCGSVQAIMALNQGLCTLAGFHVQPASPVGSLAQSTYQPLLRPGLHKIIGFARRKQGLMVARGNPMHVASIADLQRGDVRYVNRPAGSGTRLLLDELLAQAAIRPGAVSGYDNIEPSHGAVALAVASGAADAGLGIEVTARAQGLDFVPLVTEDYHLVCLKSALDQPPMQTLRKVLQSSAWQTQLAALPGCVPQHCGEVLPLSAQLPWWKFARAKRGKSR